MAGIISDDEIIYTNTAGTVRVRVAHDDSPHAPEFDGAMPTLQIESYYHGEPDASHVYGSDDYGFDGPYVWERFAANWWRASKVADVFARYVRIFHGGTTVHEHNLGATREYGYLTFDTAHWAQSVGAASARLDPADTTALAVLRALSEGMPFGPGSPGLGFATGLDEETVTAALARLAELGLAEHNEQTTFRPAGWVRLGGALGDFAEYRAYLDGECYGLILEHKVRLRITKEDLAFPARPWESDESDDWTEVETVWGIYGDDFDNALSSARGNFDLDDDEDAAA